MICTARNRRVCLLSFQITWVSSWWTRSSSTLDGSVGLQATLSPCSRSAHAGCLSPSSALGRRTVSWLPRAEKLFSSTVSSSRDPSILGNFCPVSALCFASISWLHGFFLPLVFLERKMKHSPCMRKLCRIFIQFTFSFVQHLAKCGVLFHDIFVDFRGHNFRQPWLSFC